MNWYARRRFYQKMLIYKIVLELKVCLKQPYELTLAFATRPKF